jgi:hypothetical protein
MVYKEANGIFSHRSCYATSANTTVRAADSRVPLLFPHGEKTPLLRPLAKQLSNENPLMSLVHWTGFRDFGARVRARR